MNAKTLKAGRRHSIDRDDQIPLDTVFDLVKNSRRRQVIQSLADTDEWVSIGTLATEIAAVENEKPVSAIRSTERKRVYVALYQCHLPRLASAGVVELKLARGYVRRAQNLESLNDYCGEPSLDSAFRSLPLLRLSLGSGILYAPLVQTAVVPASIFVSVVIGGTLLYSVSALRAPS